MNGEKHSRLFYHGTNIEVMLGDRVLIKRLFRKGLSGTVCYISGISTSHPGIEDGGPQWAIQMADGSLRMAGYEPENKYGYGQPRKHILFVSRGETGGISPETPLE